MNSWKNNDLIAAASPADAPPGVDERINRALEHKPEQHIPLDFAARVAARAVAEPVRRRRGAPQFGKLMALVCAVLSACALFALAPHASVANVKNLSFDAELILLVELALIGAWVSRFTLRSATR